MPTSDLLSDLASPHHSLASVAAKHNLSLDTLLTWLALPSTREHMALHESAAYSHVRYVGALNLSHAVHTTVKTLETFNATPPPADPLDPAYLRAAIQARKAAWLLYRFSRLTPLTDADIAAARTTLHATRRRESADATRLPLVPGSDAQRHQPEPVRSTNTHPEPSQVAQQVQDPPPDLGTLLTHLTTIAASLGIEASELDDPNFDPDSDLAFLLASRSEHAPPREQAHAAPIAATPSDSS